MAVPRAKQSQNGTVRKSSGASTALAFILCLCAPLVLGALQFAFEVEMPGIIREWGVIEETGRRVRDRLETERYSKSGVISSWERTEAEVREELEGGKVFDSKKQGMWIEW